MISLRRILRISAWIVGLLVVAFVVQFVVWYRNEPTWDVSTVAHGAVIRRMDVDDTLPRAIIVTQRQWADTMWQRFRAPNEAEAGFSDEQFLEGSAWNCYSVSRPDSSRRGRCRNLADSVGLFFFCREQECPSLKRQLVATISDLRRMPADTFPRPQ